MIKKKKMIILVCVSLLTIGVLSIAYALLSQSLNVNYGTVTQTALACSLECPNSISAPTCSGADAGTDSGNVRSGGTATCSKDGMNVLFSIAETKLSKPGDKCVWTLPVTNGCEFALKLSSLSFNAPTSVTCSEVANNKRQCGNIIYTIASSADASTGITTNEVLNASASKTFYLIAEFDSTKTALPSSAVTQTNGKFTVTYTQN